MASELSGVDTLAKVRDLLLENREAIQSERLNATSKMVVDMAIAITEGPTRAEGWLRTVDAIRQLFKLMLAIDGADADRILADVQHKMDELTKVRSQAADLVQ